MPSFLVAKPPFLSEDMRLWMYGMYTSAVPLLILHGLQSHDSAPLWVALVGSILMPSTATSALVSQRNTGLVELPKRHRKKSTPAAAPLPPTQAEAP